MGKYAQQELIGTVKELVCKFVEYTGVPVSVEQQITASPWITSFWTIGPLGINDKEETQYKSDCSSLIPYHTNITEVVVCFMGLIDHWLQVLFDESNSPNNKRVKSQN